MHSTCENQYTVLLLKEFFTLGKWYFLFPDKKIVFNRILLDFKKFELNDKGKYDL